MFSFGRYWNYLSYVVRHKIHVFNAGRKLGLPLLAALHDNSKFDPRELVPYARHFYEPDGSKKTHTGKDGFYVDDPNDVAFDRAWLLHISRNKHHPQHWVDIIWTPCQHWAAFNEKEEILLEDDGWAKCLTCGNKYSYGENPVDPKDPHVLIRIREMPLKYRQEMFADWIGAGMAQGNPDTRGWYKARGHGLPLGRQTRRWVEDQLRIPPQP